VPDILDVGCGNGLMLPVLADLGNVAGIEVDTSLLNDQTPYRERIYTQPLGAGIYHGLRFDLITALDVLEHIEDDQQAVRHMMRMLAPGGRLIVTVPAFMSLWDEHDQRNRHCRRYTADDLAQLLGPHGRVVKVRYLYPSLYLPKLLVRLINGQRPGSVRQHAMPPRWLSALLAALLRAEDRLTGWLPMPVGTSVLGIVEKPATISLATPVDEPELAANLQAA